MKCFFKEMQIVTILTKKVIKKVISLILVSAMVITVCPQTKLVNISAAENNEPYCISEGRPAYVSSGNNEEFAVDGDLMTRWQARYVKIIMTERQLAAYGCSFFEFQVYGDNGVVERPADYGKNLATGQPVECSGIRDEFSFHIQEGRVSIF